MSHRPEPRALLRPTPAGRSLLTVSWLLSRPVVIVYGVAEFALTFVASLNPFHRFMLNMPDARCRTSIAAGPHSAPGSRLFAGRLKGPSVSFDSLPSE